MRKRFFSKSNASDSSFEGVYALEACSFSTAWSFASLVGHTLLDYIIKTVIKPFQ